MRTFVIALAASFMVFGATSTDARANGKPGSSNLVKAGVGKPAIMDLAPGARVQGTLLKADPKGKFLEMQTAKGVVRVPVKGKLKVQNGLGKAVEETFSRANSLAARRVVIVIRSGDTIIVIIIRTRT